MNCIFCKIIKKEIPAEIVHEAGEWLAFRDVNPQAPQHVLLIPRRHLGGLPDAAAAEEPLLGSLLGGAATIARRLGLEERGYRVVVNSGDEGGQSVGHLHLHLLGGRAMSWPPG